MLAVKTYKASGKVYPCSGDFAKVEAAETCYWLSNILFEVLRRRPIRTDILSNQVNGEWKRFHSSKSSHGRTKIIKVCWL